MINIDIERIYKISNIVAIVCAIIAFLAAATSSSVSFWVPFIILIFPTSVICFMVCIGLLWSFFLTRDNK